MVQTYNESGEQLCSGHQAMIKNIIILNLAFALFSACANYEQKGPDFYSADTLVTHATHFTLVKKENCTIVRILDPWQGSDKVTMEYFLVNRGSAIPDGIDSSAVIFIPLRRVICMSVTHIAMISALGEIETISAVSGKDLIFSPALRDLMKNQYIHDVGYEAGLNSELIVKISPDLVFMYGIGGESAGYTKKIEEMGIKVLFVGDYIETDPLARAEWIKLFGAFYSKEELADSIFTTEVQSYGDICEITASVSKRPNVLLGLPYKDTWYISPGNSYISRLIADAGGAYLWNQSNSVESMPLGLENVFVKAMNADFWLNVGTASSKKDIFSVDPRFSELPCYKKGNIYNNINRLNETGGNDYWESGSVYPHLILKDLATLMHPELFGDDNELYFYKMLK